MLRLIRRGAVIAAAIVGALFLGLHFGRDWPGTEPGNPEGFLQLCAPAFAQSASVDEFPRNEVGICAYVDTADSINLSKAESAFSGIEALESDYIIGTVSLPDLPEEMWPHVYISSSGWIMAYYPKTEPTSRIVQWIGYQQGTMITNTLRDAVIQVAQGSALNSASIQHNLAYHHFQYPDATRLLVAVDTAAGSDEFSYTVPSGMTLYEASWSHFADNLSYSSANSTLAVDGTELLRLAGGGRHLVCGTLDMRYVMQDKPHSVALYSETSWSGTAVVFLHD